MYFNIDKYMRIKYRQCLSKYTIQLLGVGTMTMQGVLVALGVIGGYFLFVEDSRF